MSCNRNKRKIKNGSNGNLHSGVKRKIESENKTIKIRIGSLTRKKLLVRIDKAKWPELVVIRKSTRKTSKEGTLYDVIVNGKTAGKIAISKHNIIRKPLLRKLVEEISSYSKLEQCEIGNILDITS